MAIANDTGVLERVRDLYAQGLYHQALQAGAPLGHWRQWPGTAGQTMAARLAGNLGGRRTGSAMHLKAFANDPDDPEARLYYIYTLSNLRGPWEAWRASLEMGNLDGADNDLRTSWLGVRGHLAALLRDFDAAERWIQRAMQIDDCQPYLWVEWSGVLQGQYRFAEALEADERALDMHPWYRPAVQSAAHVMLQLNRDRDALSLLEATAERLESGDIYWQLAALQAELEMHEAARRSWQRSDELLLLKDKHCQEYLAARLSDAAYYCDDMQESIRQGEQVKFPFFRKMLDYVRAAPADARRVLLPVGFVRQHHLTCVPATLSAISGYWQMPAEHLEIAEKICYNGTPAYGERRWAEQNGYVAREFKVTWEAAVALLDAGVPFTLATVEPGSAHMQAIIGYDARRRTLLVREPSFRESGEFLAQELLERYEPSGPRGMALVPEKEAHRLAGIELPESELYDRLYRLEIALNIHDRPAALAELTALDLAAPEHRLGILGRRALASYDCNWLDLLAASEAQLRLYPHDTGAQLARLSLLGQLSRREDRLALLDEYCQDADADPLVWLQYVREWIDDSRRHAELSRRLRRMVRRRPSMAAAYHDWGRIQWTDHQREMALELFRVAACLEDTNERHAESYFVAARNVGRSGEAIAMLRGRFDRFAGKSCYPTMTLCWALAELEETPAAIALLDEALELRPDDGELLLYAADFNGRSGDPAKAQALVERAQDCSQQNRWRRTLADLALYRGDNAAACSQYEAIVSADPLQADAQRTYARLLADAAGIERVLAHLDDVALRFPHHYLLAQLRVEWLRQQDAPGAVAALRSMAEAFPTDSWTQRELAGALADEGAFEPALAAAQTGIRLDPVNSYSWSTLSYVQHRAGQAKEARESAVRAIELSVDNDWSIRQLYGDSNSASERQAAIILVYEQLCSQVTLGDGLLAWREAADAQLDGMTVLHLLMEALLARPDLWHAHSAVVQQLTSMAQLEAALRHAEVATTRFPLLPRAWVDLAEVHNRQMNVAGERAALERALEINPGWSVPVRQLATSFQRDRDFQRAHQLLEKLVAHSPLNYLNHCWLADSLWLLDRREEAVERLQLVLRFDPGYSWAWTRLSEWGPLTGKPNLARDTAEKLTADRPHEARSWLVLARMCAAETDWAGACAAAEKSLKCSPRTQEAYDLRATALANLGRYEEAAAACHPTIYGDETPVELLGRAAWVEAQQGRYEQAVEAMLLAVRQTPNYFWAWTQLADWYEQLDRPQEYLRAAEQLVVHDPFNPVSYGYRGLGKLKADDRSGAKEDWAHAVELDPQYTYAGLSLIDAHLADGESDAAEGCIATLKKHAPSNFVTVREVELACNREDRARINELFSQLCCVPDENRWPVERAHQLIGEKFGQPFCDRLLQTAYIGADTNPQAAIFYVESLGRARSWDRLRKALKPLERKPEVWRRAAVVYLQSLQESKTATTAWSLRASVQGCLDCLALNPLNVSCVFGGNPLWPFVRRYWTQLSGDPQTWGAVASVLSNANCPNEVLKWCADWRTRQDLTPRLLFPLATSFAHQYRIDDSLAVHRHALTLPADDVTPYHQLFHVLGIFGEQGLTQEGQKSLEQIDPAKLNPEYNRVFAWALEWVELISTEEPLTWSAAYGRLQLALTGQTGRLRLARFQVQAWHRLLSQLARRRNRPVRATWHRLRARWAKFFLPL